VSSLGAKRSFIRFDTHAGFVPFFVKVICQSVLVVRAIFTSTVQVKSVLIRPSNSNSVPYSAEYTQTEILRSYLVTPMLDCFLGTSWLR
jgi:hypothetical protein